MTVYNNNMEEVAAPGELVPEGTYRVRISEVHEELSENSGQPTLAFTFKIQDEGPFFGREVRSWASLQSTALFTLKGIYKACGYNPGPGGHDPSNVLDCEIYITVKHEMYKGAPSMKIPPYSFKPISVGVR